MEAAFNSVGAIPGGVVTSGIKRGGKIAKPVEELFSKLSELYAGVPDFPRRPFERDYPNGPLAGETDKLRYSSRGQKLVAKYVAGRRTVGGDDIPLTVQEVREIGEELTGNPIILKNPDPGETDWIGRVRFTSDGKPIQIYIKPGLDDKEYEEAIMHEVGHVVDFMSGRANFEKFNRELSNNYSVLAGGDYVDHFYTPLHSGYEDHEVADELAAEGFRAYFADPNYIKTAAPHFAAYIQDLVNNHPLLRRLIQLNMLLLAAGTTAAATNVEGSDRAEMSGGSL